MNKIQYKQNIKGDKFLIKKFTTGEYKFPINGFVILEVDDLINVNEAKFKFIKTNDNEDKYFVQLIEETKDSIKLFNEISTLPGEFTTTKSLNYCINKISVQLLNLLNAGFLNVALLNNNVGSSVIEIIKFRLNIYFGRELFSNIEEEIFTGYEWIKFNRERKNYITSFQRHVPQFLEKLPTLQGEFKFRIKEKKGKEITDKEGSIFIYFNQGIRRRMAKLKYIQENLWKLSELRDTGKLANLDIISGTEKSDFRFTLRIRCESYDMAIKSKIEKIVNEIQIKRSSRPKDGMWFRAKDFEGKLDNVEIRQTIVKRRFINEHYRISVDTVKEDAKGKLLDLQIINLENLRWRSMENANKLSYEEIRDTIYETVQYARRILREQKKVYK
ncbi:hypothetical protein GLOIN_2v1503721 [Rhizophagus clarus]|uniref:Uncharacterized protein n=1 Tax=Rhizophagus clarus TaxID=94130 RepID=A0A8H3L782_9GLOM|nr:hypothetical protein GLOIN_2v1503721 [Rhizophagus clarus]